MKNLACDKINVGAADDIMAEEYVINESYDAYPEIVSPSEMTPLVSGSGNSRNRFTSTASVSSWEKVGSGDDECDNEARNEVRYLC